MYVLRGKLVATVREFVWSLSEADFGCLKEAAAPVWKSWLLSPMRGPGKESTKDFLQAVNTVESSVGVVLPKGETNRDRHRIAVAVFYAVNERYHEHDYRTKT